MLGQAEVNEYGSAIIAQQDIVGLDVQVGHLVLMQIADSLGNLPDDGQGFRLREPSRRLTLDVLTQVLATDILHDVVSRAVSLETLVHLHQSVVLQAETVQPFSLCQETVQAVVHLLHIAWIGYSHRCALPSAERGEKMLLDGKEPIYRHIAHLDLGHSLIGDAKAALSQHLHDAVALLSAVEDSTYG